MARCTMRQCQPGRDPSPGHVRGAPAEPTAAAEAVPAQAVYGAAPSEIFLKTSK